MIQDSIAKLQEYIPLDDASLRIVICALLSYPFAFIFKRLSDRRITLKNLYIIAVSSFYVFGIMNLRGGVGTLLFSSLGSYFITRYLRTSSMPWVNFIFLMSHLAFNHLGSQFWVEPDPTKIDITGAQMVMVMKLSAFGWNIYDARQPIESLSLFNKSRVIKKHPNILPYLGYCFFFASLLTGPAFDYADYDKFLHSTLFDDVPELKRPGKLRKRRIPKSGIQAGSKLLQGIFFAVCLVLLGTYIDSVYIFTKEFVSDKSFLYRIFYLWGLSVTYRFKYYAIWLIAEGACIVCGIGYNGYNAETDTFKWDRVQNIEPVTFETGQNVHVCLEAWNMNTNKWLKNYVYFRVARKNKKPGFKSTLFTFCTSAFWHGTRPGYYLTFVMGALVQSLGKIYRRNLRPMFLNADGSAKPSKVVYDLICFVATQLTFGYITQPFVLLEFKKSLYVWYTVDFFVLVAVVVTFFLFEGPFKKDVKKWCQSFHSIEPKAKESTSAAATTKDYSLNDHEKEKITKIVQQQIELDEVPTLGVPLFDVLQNMKKEDIEEEKKEFVEAWALFRSRRKSILEDDFEGLYDAYGRFKEEINDIFQLHKVQAEKKQD